MLKTSCFALCRRVWHLHPTTLNEAADVSGKPDLISFVYLHREEMGMRDWRRSLPSHFLAVGFTCQAGTVMSNMSVQCTAMCAAVHVSASTPAYLNNIFNLAEKLYKLAGRRLTQKGSM